MKLDIDKTFVTALWNFGVVSPTRIETKTKQRLPMSRGHICEMDMPRTGKSESTHDMTHHAFFNDSAKYLATTGCQLPHPFCQPLVDMPCETLPHIFWQRSVPFVSA